MKKMTLLFLAAGLFFASCNKDDDKEQEMEEEEMVMEDPCPIANYEGEYTLEGESCIYILSKLTITEGVDGALTLVPEESGTTLTYEPFVIEENCDITGAFKRSSAGDDVTITGVLDGDKLTLTYFGSLLGFPADCEVVYVK